MTVNHSTKTVGTTATPLFAVNDNFTQRRRGTFSVQNNSASTVFVGGPGVTTSSFGYKLVAGDSMAFDLGPSDILYAVVASGTADINLMQVAGATGN